MPPFMGTLCLIGLVAAVPLYAAEEQRQSKFKDPEDGKFDVSQYLDTAYGFLPGAGADNGTCGGIRRPGSDVVHRSAGV